MAANPSSITRLQRLSARLPTTWDRRVREVGKAVIGYEDGRRALLRGWRFDRLAKHTDLLCAPFGDARLLVSAADHEVGRVVYATGGYERRYFAAAVSRLAAAGRPVAGTTLIDVGANIGTTTVDGLVHFGFARARSFEAAEDNAALLRLNLRLNGLEDRAEVRCVAVSDHRGELQLQRSEGNSGDHRVTVGAASADGTRAVPCDTLDSLLDGQDLADIGLVWIDVQGHDARVLRGADTLRAAGVPVVAEYWPHGAGEELGLLEELASAYGSVIDVHALANGDRPHVLDPTNVAVLRERYVGEEHTDLLLIP